MDYLSAHSTFFRGLFAGAKPLEHNNATAPVDPDQETSRKTPLPFDVPANRQPCFLPSTLTHPTLFVPVPDPTSFHLLVHWMYFGHTECIEDCLNRGVVHLPGIMKNVAYLGLPDNIIGQFLRSWERDWKINHLPPSPPYDDSDSSDGEEYLATDHEMDMEEPHRGRAVTRHHLPHTPKSQTFRACST